MSELWGFQPLSSPSGGTGSTSNLLASTTIAAVAASATAGNLPGQNFNSQCQIQIANKAAAWAFVNFGQSGSLAAATVATGYPVAPGAVVVVTVAPDANAASVILDVGAANANVIFTRGVGL